MSGIIVTTGIQRAKPEIVEAFRKTDGDGNPLYYTGTVSEALNQAVGQYGNMIPAIQPITRFCVPEAARLQRSWHRVGEAVTCLIQPADNLTIHSAIEQCFEGAMLVVAPMPPVAKDSHGHIGNLMSTQLRVKGAEGVVLQASVRDAEEMVRKDFAVWSLGLSPAGTGKGRFGEVNTPIKCGNQVVFPGDIIVADATGIIVVPQKAADVVLDNCAARVAKENRNLPEFEGGKSSIDLYKWKPKLEGVEVLSAREFNIRYGHLRGAEVPAVT